MPNIQTFIVEPGTPELAICARWRANAFSVLEASFEQELRSLELFASDRSHGVALMAKADGKPIGTCLLAESEIEPNHDVSPWLAGLFVVPEHRRKGAGTVLVRAIEDQARQRGFSRPAEIPAAVNHTSRPLSLKRNGACHLSASDPASWHPAHR